MAKLEAKALLEAVKGGSPLENDEVVRILSTRSKLHLKLVYNYYNELTTKYLDQVSIFFFFSFLKWQTLVYNGRTNHLTCGGF